MATTDLENQPTDLPKTSAPAQRALAGAGIMTLAQLSNFSVAQIQQLHGMGPKAIGILRQALAANGLTFAGEQVASAAKGAYAEVNGLKLYYEIHGTGEPLVLLHGGLGMIEMMSEVLTTLAPGAIHRTPCQRGRATGVAQQPGRRGR